MLKLLRDVNIALTEDACQEARFDYLFGYYNMFDEALLRKLHQEILSANVRMIYLYLAPETFYHIVDAESWDEIDNISPELFDVIFTLDHELPPGWENKVRLSMWDASGIDFIELGHLFEKIAAKKRKYSLAG